MRAAVSISMGKNEDKSIKFVQRFEERNTVNREYFDVKIFLDNMACAKIKHMKYMRNINNNAVQGRLSENCLT